MKVERIVTRHMDWGAGVLRGVRSHGALAHLPPHEVDAAIEHIQAAARFVERHQRQIFKQKIAQRGKPKRRLKKG